MDNDVIQVYLLTSPLLAKQNETIASQLNELAEEFPHQLNYVDVETNQYLQRKIGGQLPRLEIGPFFLTGSIEGEDIRSALKETRTRLEEARQAGSPRALRQYTQAPGLSGKDRLALWFSRHYVLLFNLLVVLYLGMAFLAPILMKLGLETSARPLYSLYRPVCHQLGFRSFYLFGEQPFYPRDLAGLGSYQSFTSASGIPETDIRAASEFLGSERMGYKLALCQRDVAIYMAILLFGLVFGLTKRCIKEIPWYIWIFLGIFPIALDGGTQLVSQLGLGFLSWFPTRESTPYLRALSGALFGFFTAWLGYPLVESSVQDRRLQLEKQDALRRGVRDLTSRRS